MKGLLPFEEDDINMYYINEAQIESFFRSLKKNRFVFLTGDPGAGKTSFLNCIALRQISAYFDNGQYEWETAKLRPGLDPLKNLAYAIANAHINTRKPDIAIAMQDILKNSSNGMIEIFEKYPLQEDKSLLLVIDNLEDIFFLESFGDLNQQSQIQAFINLLWTFEKQSEDRVYIVISFSNLFRERIAEYPKLLDLVQKNDFRFEGIAIEEIDQVVDKVISPALKNYPDIIQLKQSLKSKFYADQENGNLDLPWRFLLSHALKATFVTWNRGFTYVRDEISRKPILKELLKNKSLPLLVNELLKNETAKSDFVFDRRANECWNELTQEQQTELDRIIKSARSLRKSYSISECYRVSGGADNSIILEADEIFSYGDGQEELCESVIKSLTDKGPVLRALKYQTILKLLVDKDEAKTRRFINHFGNKGFGLLQTISSSRIEEQLNNIVDAEHIDDESVIAIRDPSLLRKDTKFERWITEEHECVSEYLLYAQMARTDSETYPITLQMYADAIMTGAPMESSKHSAIIHEFLQKDETWAALHTYNDKQYASFADTKKYIAKGVNHWRQIKLAEENRKKEEKRIVMLRRNLVVLVFMAISFFAVRTYLSVAKQNMLKQLDCLYDDYLRIVRVINFKYVDNLERGTKSDPLINNWLITLMDDTKLVDENIDSIYTEGVMEFALHYTHWKKRRNELLRDSTRMAILDRAMKDHFLESKGNEILFIEGYRLFEDTPLPVDTLYIVDCSKCEVPKH